MHESSKTNTFFLTIKGHDPLNEEEAFDKLHSWLQTYGYTSTGHGFDFKSLSVGIHKHRSVTKKEPH